MTLKIGDIVQIPKYKKTINEFGRISQIKQDTIYVSNMNMPFCGTFGNKPFHFDEVKKWEAA